MFLFHILCSLPLLFLIYTHYLIILNTMGSIGYILCLIFIYITFHSLYIPYSIFTLNFIFSFLYSLLCNLHSIFYITRLTLFHFSYLYYSSLFWIPFPMFFILDFITNILYIYYSILSDLSIYFSTFLWAFFFFIFLSFLFHLLNILYSFLMILFFRFRKFIVSKLILYILYFIICTQYFIFISICSIFQISYPKLHILSMLYF